MSEETYQELEWIINHEEIVSAELTREEIIEIYQEIERLKKDKEIDVKLNLELLDAVGKLNNILNELEKWLNYNAKHIRNNINFKEVLDKIKELRGDSK